MHEMKACELSMRCLVVVQEQIRVHPSSFTIAGISKYLCTRFEISRATAFRRVRQALDVLGVHYDERSPERRAINSTNRSEAMQHRRGNGLAIGWACGRKFDRKKNKPTARQRPDHLFDYSREVQA